MTRHNQVTSKDGQSATATSDVPWGEGALRGSTPPEIPKTLQNRAKHNPIMKTVKNCSI